MFRRLVTVLKCAVVGLVITFAACAIPKNQASFSIDGIHSGRDSQFLSNKDLMVAGLVTESLGLGASGRLFDAESRLRKAHALAPENNSVTFNLALVLGQQGYADEALGLVEALRVRQGDLPQLRLVSADVQSMQGNFDLAKDDLKVAFDMFMQAQNYPRAALVARSIANLAFASGHEQEALCYSYEALSVAPSAVELGAHASIMVALNLHKAAVDFVAEQIQLDPARGTSSAVHLANALALGALGQQKDALKESEIALDLLGDNPDVVSELNAVWWLLKQEVRPEEELDPRAAEVEEKMLESFFVEVMRLKQRPPYALLRWPPYFRELLDKVQEKDTSWWSELQKLYSPSGS